MPNIDKNRISHMTVITRFAPSPTGFLHIGSARTALFNWLFTRHLGGKFLLRVEDTDKARSTQEATDAILTGLQWLGLDWDDEPVFQSKREARHQEIVQQLLDADKAYYCYCSAEELAEMREKGFNYDRRWRDRTPDEAPKDAKPVVRIKAPLEGETVFNDLIQGTITVPNSQLDDFVILRSDGTPTYMLAVVVDDHDMHISHIIRGDDHLSNTYRQSVIYHAMEWEMPQVAHMSLIHGPDGKKLSKRHGALGVEAYKEMGYLPEAMCNYLLRLGWSHGDDEIIPQDKAIEWFTLDNVGKSPARFDFQKLDNVNAHYIKHADNSYILTLITPYIEETLGHTIETQCNNWLNTGIEELKQRVKNLKELAENALFYATKNPLTLSEKAQNFHTKDGENILRQLTPILAEQTNWQKDQLFPTVKAWADSQGIKMANAAQALRGALCYSHISPSMFDVMEVLGKEETLRRIKHLVS